MSEKGKVYVDRLPGRFEGKPWPSVDGALRFNVCSSSNQILGGHSLRQLSPFFVGPIKLTLPGEDMGGHLGKPCESATCIENFWQASKVWANESSKHIEEHVGELIKLRGVWGYWELMHEFGFCPHDFIPTAAWFTRRKMYWEDPVPHRRVKRGSGPNNDDPPYLWWLGDAMPYVEARCRMYIPMYADLVAKTPAYQELKKIVDAGRAVLLIGYDGYPVEKPLVEYLRDPKVRFGHELVLAAMLRGEEPWKELYPDIERVWEVPDVLIPDTTTKKKESTVKAAQDREKPRKITRKKKTQEQKSAGIEKYFKKK